MQHLFGGIYKNKTVLVTGHTGFKGTWLSKILIDQGAHVIGYSLEPEDSPSFFDLSDLFLTSCSVCGSVF